MQDISKIAEKNIQMKRAKEFNNEIVNIVKNIAQENELTKLDRIQIEFNKKNASENVVKIFDENMKRLSELDSHNPEYNTLINYVQWISQLPFGIQSDTEIDLKKTKKILDEDHYGLEDIKQRILEFLAVGKLNDSVRGKILCL